MGRYKQHETFNEDKNYSGFISGESFQRAWDASAKYGLNEDEEFLLAILLQLHGEDKPLSLMTNVFFKESLPSVMNALEAAADLCNVSIIVPTILSCMENKIVYALKDMADPSAFHFAINMDPNAANATHRFIGVESKTYSQLKAEERKTHGISK